MGYSGLEPSILTYPILTYLQHGTLFGGLVILDSFISDDLIFCQAQLFCRVTLTTVNSESAIQSGEQNTAKCGASFTIHMCSFQDMATLTLFLW